MDDSILLVALGFVVCLIGIGIYLLVDTINQHEKSRLAATEELVADAPAKASSRVHHLNYRSLSKRASFLFLRLSSTAVHRCGLVMISYLALSLCFVPVYEHFEYRPRRVVLTFTNAITGAPVPIDMGYEPFYYAQKDDAPEWKFDEMLLAPNVVQCRWNCSTVLDLDQAGYKAMTIDLEDDETPKVIKLQPINPSTVPTSSTRSITIQSTNSPKTAER